MRKYLRKRFNAVIASIIQQRYKKEERYHKIAENAVYRIISRKFYKKYIEAVINNEDIKSYYEKYYWSYKYIDPIINSYFTEDDYKDIDNMMKILEPVDSIISNSPKIIKERTIDNCSKYWNIVDIYIPITLTGDFNNALKIIKENNKNIMRYVKFYLKEMEPDIYNSWKFLKIDKMILTRDFQIVIKLSYKHDKGEENE